MKLKYRITWLAVSLVLTLPVAAIADPDRDESGYGNSYEHNEKMKGHSKGKHKNKNRNKYESEGNHSAGGPPPWAPAHGWRANRGTDEYDDRHEARYVTPVVVERNDTRVVVSNGNATVDVGIDQGSCNRTAIGTVMGGIVGGVIGNRVGDRDNRDVATVLGVVLGGVVGHKIGSSMDKADQHCTGQVLEQAHDNQTVRWADHNNQGQYSVTPLRTYQADGNPCRDFVTEYRGDNGIERERSTACRNSSGAWSKLTM